MHKLIDYICEELEELDRKVDKEGKLSMTEVQYGDMLAHFKKNLLKSEEMMDGEEYSMSMMGGNSYRRGSSYDGEEIGQSRRGGSSYRMRSSYARGRGRNARRDVMGRYSSSGADEMLEELHELMREAPDDKTRMEFERFIEKIEQMQ